MLRNVWALIRLTRPVFLLGGVTLYSLGTAMAASQGVSIRLDRMLLGQVMVTAIQLFAQYANEYFDADGDALNTRRTWFSGGSGVLGAGGLARAAGGRAMRIAAVFGAAAIVGAATQSPATAALGALCMLGAWAYSAPPLSLMGSGLGELSASLIVAFLTPLTAISLHGGRLDAGMAAALASLVLLHWAMLLAFSLPDRASDAAVGKRTLVVRMGAMRAATAHTVLIGAALALLAALGLTWPPARFVWIAFPAAIWQAGIVMWHARRHDAGANATTTGAVGLFVLASAALLLGFVFA